MTTTFTLLGLALGIGFAFFVPVFFTTVAGMNAALGYPEAKRILPRIFKIGFWFSLVASSVGIAAISFLKEDRAELAITAVTGLVLAWRFRRATMKSPNQSLVPTPASVTPAAGAPDAGAAHL
jgi:hypothetical protein